MPDPATSTPEAEAPPPVQLLWPAGTPVLVKQAKGKTIRTSIIGGAVNGRIPCGGVVGGAAPEDLEVDRLNLPDSPVADRFDGQGNLLQVHGVKDVVETTLDELSPPAPADQDRPAAPTWPSGTAIQHVERPEKGLTIGEPFWSDKPAGWRVIVRLAQGEVEVACEDWIPRADDAPPMIPGDPDEPKPKQKTKAKQQTLAETITLGNGKTMTVGELDAVMRKEERMRKLGQTAAELHAEYLAARSHSHDLYERWKEKMKELGELAGSDVQLSLFGQKGVGEPKEAADDLAKFNAYEEGVQARQNGQGAESCPYDNKMPDWRRDWQMGWEAEQKRQTSEAPTVMDTRPKSGAPDRLVDGRALGLDPDKLNALVDQTEALSWTNRAKDLPKLEKAAKDFHLYDKPWLVVDYYTAEDESEVPAGHEAFELRPLWEQEEWDQLHPEMGKPIETSSDPRCDELEREHGLLAARRLKLGRRKLVIGTTSDRLLVLFAMQGGPDYDGKAAAAGDRDHDEMDEAPAEGAVGSALFP